ncbi:tRNA-splicing endonuclease subunit Sen34 [Drosophila guanche]|uniref:tRNA-splicing endonuclease subunit Sen34 n=1 Tax=Drosophila guanche TaxID=7266 RepID=A0A3B0J386_DROGU|nr:tRNA-splicing endonuclease subunit Sen34 [Drosophila guanche]XP_034121978.1 tRNA-splicing endonuclease subunit Sen34 [Drosophila guanche]SPP76054.1 blast:tRNA-splicing endonuclease subunit Sen34 [Drosophila guanche]
MYLTLLNGTGYVFSVDDYMELRSKHRLMGALVGTANTKGWSPNQSTLPVELTKFETQLILDEGLALLVNKSKALGASPMPKELEEYRSELDKRLEGQADALKSEKLRETERYMDKILLGKRNKLLKQGLATKAGALVGEDVLKEVADNFEFDLQNALVEVPCKHLVKHTAQIVPEPLVDTSCVRYRIFRDLWLRGKFVTSGEAFGADFLVYPGDPLIYHASHIVIAQSTSPIKPLDLIAKVRLSVIVNKSCVFAREKIGEGITYQTVAWCNPSK